MKRISYVLSLKVVTSFLYISQLNQWRIWRWKQEVPAAAPPPSNSLYISKCRLISEKEIDQFLWRASRFCKTGGNLRVAIHLSCWGISSFQFFMSYQWQTRRVVPNPVSRGVIGQDPPLILIQDESKHLPPSLFRYHHQSKPGGLNITSLHPLYTFNKSIFSSFSSFLITVLVSSCLFLPRPFLQRLLYFCNQYLRLEKHLLRTNPSPWHQASSSLLLLVLRCLIVANVFSRKTDANKPVGPKYGPGPNFGPGSFTL